LDLIADRFISNGTDSIYIQDVAQRATSSDGGITLRRDAISHKRVRLASSLVSALMETTVMDPSQLAMQKE